MSLSQYSLTLVNANIPLTLQALPTPDPMFEEGDRLWVHLRRGEELVVSGCSLAPGLPPSAGVLSSSNRYLAGQLRSANNTDRDASGSRA